jgi:hypothetical protein
MEPRLREFVSKKVSDFTSSIYFKIGLERIMKYFNSAIKGFRPIYTETGTSKTLALIDANAFIIVDNPNPVNITIPLESDVNFKIGTEIDFIQKGVGVLSFVPTATVLLNGASIVIPILTQWGGATIKKIGSDEWIIVGKI